MLLWLGAVSAAPAVEYRLRVVSLFEDAFSAMLSRQELQDGASGPGLDRLEQALDVGMFPAGAILYDRPLRVPDPRMARAFAAVPARAEVGGGGGGSWAEVRWEGTPGDLSVWLVGSTALNTQELSRAALKGGARMRQYLVTAAIDGQRLAAVKYSQLYLDGFRGRPDLWDDHLSRVLDLDDGIGLVVGSNDAPLFADHAYIVVRQTDLPTTFKAVLAWRRRLPADFGHFESPGVDGNR